MLLAEVALAVQIALLAIELYKLNKK